MNSRGGEIGNRDGLKIHWEKSLEGSSPSLGTNLSDQQKITLYKLNHAYVTGIAIGDGNLSNPNGRAIKLRVSCDLKYPHLINRISNALQMLLPTNKVGVAKRPGNWVDIYIHSNKLEQLLEWKVGRGSKHQQRVRIPSWIKENREYTIACLRGLFETDGTVYMDRNYLMASFTTIIPELSEDTFNMITSLNFTAHTYKIKSNSPSKTRYNVRVSKNTLSFINTIKLRKN